MMRYGVPLPFPARNAPNDPSDRQVDSDAALRDARVEVIPGPAVREQGA